MERKFSFENLEVYQKCRALVTEVYRVQRDFPTEERYGLCDQVRRAAVSITANLAEGSGRQSLKENQRLGVEWFQSDWLFQVKLNEQ